MNGGWRRTSTQTKCASQFIAILFAIELTQRYVVPMAASSPLNQPRPVKLPNAKGDVQSSAFADEEFGACLYRHRQVRRLSQAALAKQAAISAGYLSELENGKRKPPTQRVVKQLAEALGLSTQERHRLLCLAATERALASSEALSPKLALLIQALHAAAPSLPEQTIDKLINTLEEAEM